MNFYKLIKPAVCGALLGLVVTTTSTEALANEGTIYITTSTLRFRAEPSLDALTIEMVGEGINVRVIDRGTNGWYQVELDGIQGYMYAEFLEPQVSTNLPASTNTSTSTIAASTNNNSQPTDFVTTANLRLRSGPSFDAPTIQTVPEGRRVWVIETRADGWYVVEYNNIFGYMYSEFLTNGAPTYFMTTANLRLRAEPSLDAQAIQTIPQGRRVQVIDRGTNGWYLVEHDGVQGYMYSEFLFDVANGNHAVNGVELLEWSYLRNNVIRTGVPLMITDVRTGIVYWVSSFSNGNHADVNPLTADDTAALLQTFNGTWSWATRPVLVTVDGRTLAASINGMPHGGSTNPDNNMNGHVCLHFLGSRTHNGSTGHERDHQNSVQEAFRSAS